MDQRVRGRPCLSVRSENDGKSVGFSEPIDERCRSAKRCNSLKIDNLAMNIVRLVVDFTQVGPHKTGYIIGNKNGPAMHKR